VISARGVVSWIVTGLSSLESSEGYKGYATLPAEGDDCCRVDRWLIEGPAAAIRDALALSEG